MEFITNSNLPRYTPAYPHLKNLNQHNSLSVAHFCAPSIFNSSVLKIDHDCWFKLTPSLSKTPHVLKPENIPTGRREHKQLDLALEESII